ncbi:MAG: DUF4091 domain-containing protein [Deltaproteobacteria bacterium]|nr:DUF4091 domain-containing protein [Deltaproteobacteria bacterium]
MRAVALGWAALLACSHTAHAELAAVWALDDGTKVNADQLAHPLRAGNAVFSKYPPLVRLFAARNETVAFQVILQGGAAETARVGVELANVGPIRNVRTTDQPDRYFVGRRIELLKELYLPVKQGSKGFVWRAGSAAEPSTAKGLVPDPLVPLRAGERFTVPGRRNQGVWIDVYVPRDTPPGTHRGTVRVSIGGAKCALPTCELPVELQVLPATLPDVSSTKSMLYFSGHPEELSLSPRYFGRGAKVAPKVFDALVLRHHRLARRHRVELFAGHDKAPTALMKELHSGRAYTAAAGYEGPGMGVGQEIYSISTYGGKLSGSQVALWTSWFARHAPKTRFFLYVKDEPGRKDFPEINRVAAAARPVLSFVTNRFESGLEVDIYCTYAGEFSVRRMAQAQKKGKHVWIYNGSRPFSGTLLTDDSAIAPRVNPWIQYKHGIPWWFYWESTYYDDFQGKRGPTNVYADPLTFTNTHGDRLLGDGVLFYPGRDRLFPKEDRGIDAPLPSIRLKNWRRGIEDVEYLVLARQKGHGAAVDALLRELIPQALSDETKVGEAVSWSEEGQDWLAARKRLARLIAGSAGGKLR